MNKIQKTRSVEGNRTRLWSDPQSHRRDYVHAGIVNLTIKSWVVRVCAENCFVSLGQTVDRWYLHRYKRSLILEWISRCSAFHILSVSPQCHECKNSDVFRWDTEHVACIPCVQEGEQLSLFRDPDHTQRVYGCCRLRSASHGIRYSSMTYRSVDINGNNW